MRFLGLAAGALLAPAALLLSAPAFAQTTAVEVNNGAGSTLVRIDSTAGLVAHGTSGTGVIPATGEGVRMMWYPGKYAFRAGSVNSYGATYWDDGNVVARQADALRALQADLDALRALRRADAEQAAALSARLSRLEALLAPAQR